MSDLRSAAVTPNPALAFSSGHTAGTIASANDTAFCNVHPGIALTEYDGQPWCRVCAADEFAYVEQYRRGLSSAQWVLAFAVPFVLLGWAGLAPYRPGVNPQGTAFWAWLLPPTAFLATFLVVLLGHFGLRTYFQRQARGGPNEGPLRWFHATHLLRDLSLMAIATGILYALLVFQGAKFGLPVGKAVAKLPGWLLWRGIPLFAVSAGALWLLCRFRLVNEDALLPIVDKKHRYLLVYAALLPFGYLILQRWLEVWARSRPGPWLFLGGLLALLAAVGFYLYTWREFRYEQARRSETNSVAGTNNAGTLFANLGSDSTGISAGRLQNRRAPRIPVTIALVGPPSSGKTVFLARAYERMKGVLGGVFAIAPSKESERALAPVRHRLETLRQWPDPTAASPKEIPFALHHLADEIVRFHWLDLPGGAFTYADPNAPEYARFEEARQRFSQQLGNADALLFVFDAEMVAAHLYSPSLAIEDIYLRVLTDLFGRLETLGPAARPIPLAMVVTKCDKVGQRERELIPARLAFLPRYYREMAASRGLSLPPARLFLTTAVAAKRDAYGEWLPPPPGEPMASANAREPILWLAAQTLRAHVGALDFILGFQNRSPLQSVIVRLEAVAGD